MFSVKKKGVKHSKKMSNSSGSSISKYAIATIGSHSALQILKGAKDEGFHTIAICMKGREKPYRMFGVADEIITIQNYAQYFTVEKKLLKRKNVVIIPHASFVEYIGTKNIEKIKLPYFGNKKILEWEIDRNLERKWLKASGLRLPRIYKNPEDINKSVIVKFHGAKGGMGYFIANSEKDFKRKIVDHIGKRYVLQEYIIGVPMYIHYFYSPITNELEVMSFDKRYESNVDSLGRISARDQIALETVDPSYVIVGNIPLVIRESLLPRVIEMGEAVIRQSKKIVKGGLFGPFCLETIVTPEQEFYVFEISARIVAGTNPFIDGSPYTQLRYKEPMSTGRRIAREIKTAINKNVTNKIFN